MKLYKQIYIVACGSAYHVGMVGKYALEKMMHIPVEACLASEFRYSEPILVRWIITKKICLVENQDRE